MLGHPSSSPKIGSSPVLPKRDLKPPKSPIQLKAEPDYSCSTTEEPTSSSYDEITHYENETSEEQKKREARSAKIKSRLCKTKSLPDLSPRSSSQHQLSSFNQCRSAHADALPTFVSNQPQLVASSSFSALSNRNTITFHSPNFKLTNSKEIVGKEDHKQLQQLSLRFLLEQHVVSTSYDPKCKRHHVLLSLIALYPHIQSDLKLERLDQQLTKTDLTTLFKEKLYFYAQLMGKAPKEIIKIIQSLRTKKFDEKTCQEVRTAVQRINIQLDTNESSYTFLENTLAKSKNKQLCKALIETLYPYYIRRTLTLWLNTYSIITGNTSDTEQPSLKRSGTFLFKSDSRNITDNSTHKGGRTRSSSTVSLSNSLQSLSSDSLSHSSGLSSSESFQQYQSLTLDTASYRQVLEMIQSSLNSVKTTPNRQAKNIQLFKLLDICYSLNMLCTHEYPEILADIKTQWKEILETLSQNMPTAITTNHREYREQILLYGNWIPYSNDSSLDRLSELKSWYSSITESLHSPEPLSTHSIQAEITSLISAAITCQSPDLLAILWELQRKMNETPFTTLGTTSTDSFPSQGSPEASIISEFFKDAQTAVFSPRFELSERPKPTTSHLNPSGLLRSVLSRKKFD